MEIGWSEVYSQHSPEAQRIFLFFVSQCSAESFSCQGISLRAGNGWHFRIKVNENKYLAKIQGNVRVDRRDWKTEPARESLWASLWNQDKLKPCVSRLSYKEIFTFHRTILFLLFPDKNNYISVTFVFCTTAMVESWRVMETLSLSVAYWRGRTILGTLSHTTLHNNIHSAIFVLTEQGITSWR